MKPDGTNQGVRPGFLLLSASLVAATLSAVWISHPKAPPADVAANEPATQPSADQTRPWDDRRSTKAEPQLSANSASSQNSAGALPRPDFVTPQGDLSAAYSQRVAQAVERAVGRTASQADPIVAMSPNTPNLVLGSAQAGDPPVSAGLASESAPGSSVEAYRKSDQTRRALVEEMKKVRRAMLEEASRQGTAAVKQ